MLHLEPETIIDYLHQALDAGQDAAVFGHIQECQDCHALHDAEIALIDSLRTRAATEEREFPDSLRLAILETVCSKKAQVPFLKRLIGPLRPALLSATALVAAGVVVAAPHLIPNSNANAPEKAVTASAFFSRHDAASIESPLADHSGAPSIEAAAFVADDGEDASASSPN